MAKNTKEKSPAYQWYPKDVLSDGKVTKMTSAQEGAYRRLLDFCWLEGFLPNDENELLALCKADITIEDVRVVMKCLKEDSNDPTKLNSERQIKERIKQAKWSEKSSEGGKASAAKRYGTGEPTSYKGGSKMVEPKANIPFSSSSSSSNKYIIEREIFDNARKSYPGDKRGNETEFANFIKKHADWRNVLPTLEEKIKNQISARDKKVRENKFVPEWKKLTTWINQRCWEEEIGEGVGKPGEEKKPVYKGDFYNKKKP